MKGLLSPDEDTVRRKHLEAGVAAPDWATVNDFLRFHIVASRPRLDADRPTVDSINVVAEWFFAGLSRVTGTKTDEGERSEVYNVSSRAVAPSCSPGRNTDHLPLGAPDFDSRGDRRQQTLADTQFSRVRPYSRPTRVLLALWTRDDLLFIPERYRVQATFIIHIYC